MKIYVNPELEKKFSSVETLYDVQIGGQCPAILYNLKESELKSLNK